MRVIRLAAALLLVAACGQAPRPSVGMKEYSGDVVYGDNAAPPPPTSPPGAEPLPGFPGFIVPPAPRPDPVAPAVTPGSTAPPPATTPTTAPAAVACPEDDPLDVPADEAQGTVPGPPRSATLPYRQRGRITSPDGRFEPLPPAALHRVDGQTAIGAGTFRFNVGVQSGSLETVTTFQVDQRGAQDGIGIVQIRTKDQVATDAFTPAAPITVLPIPPVQGRTFTGAGSDPVHQTAMTIFGKVMGKDRVNACGRPIEGWLVRVGTDPQSGQPSTIVSPTGTTVITGTYVVATQYGGLVVADDLTLDGSDARGPFQRVQESDVDRVPQQP
jgi:hypothetical protein